MHGDWPFVKLTIILISLLVLAIEKASTVWMEKKWQRERWVEFILIILHYDTILVEVYIFVVSSHIIKGDSVYVASLSTIQGDYVLCRLFHKTNDKIDNSNSDEVEPTGSSPSTGKSSPDVTSDLFQEPAALGTEVKGSENVRKQWAHEVDHLISLMQAPSGSNTASEVR